jgi:hypothetical protein
MHSPVIRFSQNWNKKLDTAAFTTLRLHNPMRHQRLQVFKVMINSQHYCNAKLIAVKPMKLSEVDEYTARLDSGLPKHKFVEAIKRMYKSKGLMYDKQLFDLLLFERMDSQGKMNL